MAEGTYGGSGAQARRTRVEHDSMGAVEVPADRLWGAQTARSLVYFAIGDERMPLPVVHAYGLLKAAAARVNGRDGRLPAAVAAAVAGAAGEVARGELDEEFPLRIWQTGSGTQTNMNVNEVVANRAAQLLGDGTRVHPNDHVNAGQSSNDTFPTAMHVAAALQVRDRLLPAAEGLLASLRRRGAAWDDVVKIGRTHLQDAVPLTVGQEWSGWSEALADALDRVRAAAAGLHRLAIGGTAVGTGLNAPPGFGAAVAADLAAATGLPFGQAPNLFVALGTLDAMVAVSGALRGLASTLLKVAEDVRWLGSGPRCGLHELVLPANEPGSSIMPGKVNPTQSEAMVMVCVQVMGLDAAVGVAGSAGHFELNTMRPLVVADVLAQVRLLADACASFREHCMDGVELDRARIDAYVRRSPMLVTALAPEIGYERAAQVAHLALAEDLPLREAALRCGVDAETFDRLVDPSAMVGR